MVDPHKIVKDCLVDFKFGATIEVTNGLGSEYHKKAQQALRASDFFYHLTEKQAHIASGLAYLVSKRTMEDNMGLNIILKVDRYTQRRLYVAMAKMLSVPSVGKREADLVQRILEKKDTEWHLDGFLNNSTEELESHADYIDWNIDDYKKSLPLIKGFVMELYVGSLFEEQLAEKHIFHRHKFKHKGRRGDADVVACKKRNFYGAIERLNQMNEVQAQILTRKTD